MSGYGRINPTGISYLYLSSTSECCIHEIKLSVENCLSIVTFKIVRSFNYTELTNFNLLDLLTKDISREVFTGVCILYKILSVELSKSFSTKDKELSYIPLQYISEFFKSKGSEGIYFNSSVSTGGKNLTLFTEECIICLPLVKQYKIIKNEIVSEISTR